MKKIIFLNLLVCTFGIASPTIAQDTSSEQSKCDLPSLQKLIDTYIDTLGTLKTKKETDPTKITNELQTLANIANMQRAACDGLVFSGSKQLVIGPVTIPAGIYRAKATTSEAIIVDLTIVDGECGDRTTGEHTGIFALSGGQAKDTAETLFTSKGCTALIEVSLVRADWQLAFERISTE